MTEIYNMIMKSKYADKAREELETDKIEFVSFSDGYNHDKIGDTMTFRVSDYYLKDEDETHTVVVYSDLSTILNSEIPF